MTSSAITKSKTLGITISALFAALACISTMIIQIPTPTNGYVHMGDCFVLLAGFLLGPVLGGAAAGIGSMFADIFTGYAYYAPATFIIKGLMAVCGYFIYKFLSNTFKKYRIISVVIASIISEIIMIAGYFIFSAVFLGTGLGAVAGIPGNIVQALFAIIVSPMLFAIISRNPKIDL